ncbi:hypothetical protein H0H93_012877 [Arthromyces matolae]|nr:hypothetical protein H0H93_012877 [Arthromyces matolae]
MVNASTENGIRARTPGKKVLGALRTLVPTFVLEKTTTTATGKGGKQTMGFQPYDSAQSYDGSNTNERNQAADSFHDYGQEDRQQRNKKRLAPSEPSSHVIFLGLDLDFTEADVSSSKGFGFAQFTTTEHARAFVDPLFPFIQVPPPASHGASATAAYYKALESGAPHNGRRVKIDYSQSASPHDRNRFNRGNLNDGTRDIGNTQAPVLLFRGLDPLSGPQAIHQAMLYSSGPSMQGAKGMRRIILIKDKVTMASFGFAFVEFVDVPSASAVLAATMSPTIHPAGFRISDRPVAASFAHPYSFQPVTDFLQRDDSCLRSSMTLGGVDDTWVRYWDENSTVAVLEFKVEEPSQSTQIADKKKEKKKKSEVEAQPTPVAPSALPVSDKPVTLSFSKGPIKVTAVKPSALAFSMDEGAGEDDDEAEDATALANKGKFRRLRNTASNISKWTQVQEELNQNISGQSTPSVTLATRALTSAHSADLVSLVDQEFEFADTTGLACLLCARQFKTLDQLKRHNKESDLHKARNSNAVYTRELYELTFAFVLSLLGFHEQKNIKDATLRDVARQKVAARKASAQEQPKYRDRALERRVLFNQPETPLPDRDTTTTAKSKKTDGPPAPPSPPPPPVNPGQDASNIGNKLLKMMGWSEGSGLGTSGEGRVDPIQTAMYAQGAGLGASKGKEIGKYTEGYSGYVHMAQDAVSDIVIKDGIENMIGKILSKSIFRHANVMGAPKDSRTSDLMSFFS